MMSHYSSGYNDVFRALGMHKLANPVARWTAKNAPGFLHSVRTNIVGQPIKAYRQLREGTLFGKGGLVRHGLSAPGTLNKVLLYGLPAGMAAYTMAGDDPDKYEQIGGLAAGTLLGNAAFGPAGMLGAMGGMALGDRIGRHAGGAVRTLATGEPSQATGPAPKPRHQAYPYVQAAGLLAGSGG
jgi:hypothetical protein